MRRESRRWWIADCAAREDSSTGSASRSAEAPRLAREVAGALGRRGDVAQDDAGRLVRAAPGEVDAERPRVDERLDPARVEDQHRRQVAVGEVELHVVADQLGLPPGAGAERRERDGHADGMALALAQDVGQQQRAVAARAQGALGDRPQRFELRGRLVDRRQRPREHVEREPRRVDAARAELERELQRQRLLRRALLAGETREIAHRRE